jgi:hypothetical protein
MSGTLAIANDTTQKNWEDNLTGNNYVGVWNANYTAIWHLDNSTNDSSRYGHNGTYQTANCNSTIAGIFGTACFFNGNAQYINTTNTSLLNPPNITVEAWVNLANSTGFREIVAKYNTTSSNKMSWLFRTNNGLIEWYVAYTTVPNYKKSGCYTLSVNNWYYIVGTYNSTHICDYINGTLDNCVAQSGSIPSSGPNVTIGSSSAFGSANTEYWNGTIDEVRISNYSMNATQIMNNYYQGIGNLSRLGAEESSSISGLTISLSTPADGAINNTRTDIDFKFTPLSYGQNVTNCSVWTNDTGSWAKTQDNTTQMVNNTLNSILHTFSADKTILWNIGCYNTTNLVNATANRTLKMDTTPPTIAIISPTNATYNNQNWVWANATADEAALWCGVSLNNSANQTLTNLSGTWNLNLTVPSTGSNNATVFCNDTAGNMNYSNPVYFTVSSPLTLTVTTPINTTTLFNTTYYINPLTFSGSTSILTNITYSLNGATNVTLCTNCNSFSNSTGLGPEGWYNVTFYAVAYSDATNVVSTYRKFYLGSYFKTQFSIPAFSQAVLTNIDARIYSALFAGSASANTSLTFNDFIGSAPDSNAVQYPDGSSAIYGLAQYNFTLAERMVDNFFTIIDACNATTRNSRPIAGGFLPTWIGAGCNHIVSGPPRLPVDVWKIYLLDSNKTWLNSHYQEMKWHFYWYINNRNISGNPANGFGLHFWTADGDYGDVEYACTAESNNDGGDRWSGGCRDKEAIELNAGMWYFAITMQNIINETGNNTADLALWQNWADVFYNITETRLWNPAKNWYQDYDVVDGFNAYKSGYGVYPFFVGMVNNTTRINNAFVGSLTNISSFMRDYGYPSISADTVLNAGSAWQYGVWGSPEFEAVKALDNYGYYSNETKLMYGYFLDYIYSQIGPEGYGPDGYQGHAQPKGSNSQAWGSAVLMDMLIENLFGVTYDNHTDNRLYVFPKIPTQYDSYNMSMNVSIPMHGILRMNITNYADNNRSIGLNSSDSFNVTLTLPLPFTSNTNNFLVMLKNNTGTFDVTTQSTKIDLDKDGTYEAYQINTTIGSSIVFYTTTGLSTPTIYLWLNQTQGNKAYTQYQIANFTAVSTIAGLPVNISTNITGWVEPTGITSIINLTNLTTVGVFNITAYWVGNNSYLPASTTYFVTVATSDNAPTSSNIQTSYPSSYASTLTWMNVTWTDTDATPVDKVFIETDYSGSYTNYTPNNISSVYFLNRTLPAGTFHWRSYANDTGNNWSTSTLQTFTINKVSPGITLVTNTSSWTITYPTATNVTGNACPSQLTCTMWRNDAVIWPWDDNQLFSVGNYNYTYYTAGNANYTTQTVQHTLIVQASGTSPMGLTLTYNKTTNTNGLSTFNETFTSGGNQVFYVNLPKNSTVTRAVSNVSGYTNMASYTNITKDSTAYSGNWNNPSLGYDNDFGTSTNNNYVAGNLNMDNNFKITQNNILNVTWIAKIQMTDGAFVFATYYVYNYTSSSYQAIGNCGNLYADTCVSPTTKTFTFNQAQLNDFLSGQIIKFRVGFEDVDASTLAYFYESEINVSYNGYPQNPSLSIVNQIWNYTGAYSDNQQTNDFTTEVQTYLKSCIPYVDNSCDVPFTVHSDSAGIMQINLNTTITYDTQTYDSSVYEGQNSNFWVQVNSTNDITDVNGYLEYNGTSYPADSESQAGTYWAFNKLLTIPSVAADENVSFYWNFSYTNATGTYEQYFSSNTQLVQNLNILNNCTGGNITLNITTFDEETKEPIINNLDMDMTYTYGSTTNTFTNSFTGNSTYLICLNTTSVIADATIKYWNTSYTTRFYYLQSMNLSNTVSYVNLYLSNQATSIQYFVTNELILGQSGMLIEAERYFIGTGSYPLVAEGLTDSNGYAYINLKNNEWYKYILVKNGEIVKVFDKMYLNQTSYTLQYSSIEGTPYFNYYNSIAYSDPCPFNNITNTYSCTITDTSGKMLNSYLIVKNKGTGLTVCNANSSSPSVTLTCTLPNVNGTYSYDFIGKFSGSQTWYSFSKGIVSLPFVQETVSRFGLTGLIAGFMLVLACFFIGLFNPVISIILGLGGLSGGYLLGLFNTTNNSLQILIAIWVMGVFIAYKMKS